ncbi:MAG: prepilin-type N-terminal cleavage/methylation domain-containing protein [Deferribacteraceae bacterium]|jgi:prepilin-type N-terminal cleavage/methylation domain-containing protein|nr:prepilin-type N-terminal cleavage/methylation domain-containing protein [Deferribacteraceae bacterium]
MKKGFTLVELAIVIVIIGILIGMVFKGQTIYENSKLRYSIKNIELIRSAFSNIAMDYEGLIPDNNSFDTADLENPSAWNNGRYDPDQLFIKHGLLTNDSLIIYRRPGASWEFVSCNKGAENTNEHYIITDNHSGKHVCLFGEVSERFSCYFEKIMDDDNVTNAFARNKTTIPGSLGNFKSCSEAPLSDRSEFAYILY